VKSAIVVHGGAWNIPQTEHPAHQNGCRLAAEAGYRILGGGGAALDAVETAVTLLEDDPTFDAGLGSHLNRDGVVQLDAGIMDGATLQVGAVAAIEQVRNPIQIARRLLASDHNMFVGAGATEWARRSGIQLVDSNQLVVPRERSLYERLVLEGPPDTDQAFRRADGTVGAVAIDKDQNLAAATSTGGLIFKPAGRVGDSPLPGCGYYADNQSGAVSTTGHGECIIRVQLARTAADLANTLVSAGSKQDLYFAMRAAQTAIDTLANRVEGYGGLIMIDRLGRIGFAYNTPHLAHAFFIEGLSEPVVGI
jgi:beta-aspartyl-peptidase (threonine type)